MSAQVYSVPDQTEGRRKPFRSGKAWTLNYLLPAEVMLTVIKVFIILFLLMGIGNILASFKTNQ